MVGSDSVLSYSEREQLLLPSTRASKSLRSTSCEDNKKIESLEARMEDSDEVLFQRFRLGEEHAFVTLYSRRQAELFTFCLRICGGDNDLASDAFQETFIRIYERADQYRGENLRAWFLRIARNACLDIFRKKTPARLEDEHYEIESNDRSTQPEFPLEQEVLRGLIENAIERLPISLREAFVLREFEGLSHIDIAETMDISVAAARQKIWRARMMLREYLLPNFIEERGDASSDTR